jgi:hypothetical protein
MGDKQLSIPYQEQGATRLHGGSIQFHNRNRELRGSLGDTQLSIPYQEQGATRLHEELCREGYFLLPFNE